MEEHTTISKRKGIIIKISIGFVCVLIVLTFLSKTISGMFLPQVTLGEFKKGSLNHGFSTSGTIEMKDEHPIIAYDSFLVKKVMVERYLEVKKGDVIATVDIAAKELALKSMELNIVRLENAITDMKQSTGMEKAALDRALKEKALELEIMKAQYELEKKKIPADGKILADVDGVVSSIAISEGEYTKPNLPVVELVVESTFYRVVWYMGQEESISYDTCLEIVMSGTSSGIKNQKFIKQKIQPVIKSYSLPLKINGKEFLTENNQVRYWADFTETDLVEKVAISVNEGQVAAISSNVSTNTYNFILPMSAIHQENSKYYIYVLKEKPSALGPEKFVEQKEVRIADKDSMNAAIDGYFETNDKIVISSTEILTNGMQVREG